MRSLVRRGTAVTTSRCGPCISARNVPALRCSTRSLSTQHTPTSLALGTRIRDVSHMMSAPTGDEAVVSLRGRVHATRVKGKVGFLTLRQSPTETLQVVVAGEAAVASGLLECVKQLTPESVVDVTGCLSLVPKPIQSATCAHMELQASSLAVVTAAETPLPFPLQDPNTKLDTRLDHRIIDMRTPTTAAVLRLTSKAGQFFRDYLIENDFIEIHSPKMIGTPSEGGSAVFQLSYFDKPAFLAQSPQLFKQMALMGDLERVFEVGPVFRAEKSLTHRHLTEFTGLDAEMIIRESHTEVLDVLEGTLHAILSRLDTECGSITAAVADRKAPIRLTLPVDKIKALGLGIDRATSTASTSAAPSESIASTDAYGGRVGHAALSIGSGAGSISASDRSSHGPPQMLRLPFDGAMQMLVDDGAIPAALDDFNVAQEKRLGELIGARYGVDVYVIDQFPQSARPFYTMPDPNRPGRTRSYDMYLRGEEICSGAQRIHDPVLLLERAAACGVDTTLISDYVNSFRYGAYPHGGFGLGLERIVLFYLGLHDVRQVSMFPRDPKRITP